VGLSIHFTPTDRHLQADLYLYLSQEKFIPANFVGSGLILLSSDCKIA